MDSGATTDSAMVSQTSASQANKDGETAMRSESEALKFVEIVPDDTYNGYLILKRGSVIVNESLMGAGEVR